MRYQKGNVRTVFIISIFLLFSFSIIYSSTVHATSPQKKLSVIEQKLKTKKQKVKEALEKEQSILTKIHTLEQNINKKEKELNEYRERIAATQSEIDTLGTEMSALENKISQRKVFLKERLKSLYKQQYGDSTLILVSAKDYNDFIRRSRYISLIAYNDRKMMDAYTRDLDELNVKITNLELLKEKLEISKSNAQKKKKDLKRNQVKKNRLLATVRSKRSTYEKAIEELNESSKKLRELIKKFEKKKIPGSVLGKGFRSWRGHLPWPVNGKVIVPFGKYKDPQFNIVVFKNGMEIEAKEGYRPQAVAGGQVVYADWFKGYGQLLIINHGDGYHSLYGNLKEIFHKTGDIIKQGTSIGKTGRSELLNVPTLYFEIRYKGKPVDPMKWLKRKSRR